MSIVLLCMRVSGQLEQNNNFTFLGGKLSPIEEIIPNRFSLQCHASKRTVYSQTDYMQIVIMLIG